MAEQETVIVLRIKHRKNLPAGFAPTVENRVYGYLYSQGVEASVKGTLADLDQLAVRQM